MKYWVPDLYLATQLPPQSDIQDKLGGLPWGLPRSEWPFCRVCGDPLIFIGQFVHNDQHFDLGLSNRVIFIFQCDSQRICPSWEGGGGANACFLLDPQELAIGATPLPREDSWTYPEARVLRWLEREDNISPDLASAFYDDERLWKLPEHEKEKPASATRVGSVPAWIQSTSEAPGDGWRFMCQLDSLYNFYTQPPDPDEIGCPVERKMEGKHVYEQPLTTKPGAPAGASVDDRHHEGRNWTVQGPTFGDWGTAYVFFRENDGKPQGWFFWQC